MATLEERAWKAPPWEALRVGPGFRLADVDRASTPGWHGSKKDAEDLLAHLGSEMSELQERLFARGRKGDPRSVLLVLQGLDTAGKGGIARHVIGMVDPQGVVIRNFGPPSLEEREHHFLWRIHRALPGAGRIGVFDRSHYEDVLVVRVEQLVPEATWQARYAEINGFEEDVVAGGTTIIKCALMVSHEEQGARLLERLDRPEKRWKYNPNDLPTRMRWDDYQDAYQAVFDRTSTPDAPWYVIPADHKWYARLAVAELLTEALRRMSLEWPPADFNVDAERATLAATMVAPSRRSVQAEDEDLEHAEPAGIDVPAEGGPSALTSAKANGKGKGRNGNGKKRP
jgi:PPK2 family polyphosphate:nucleotide phosphotransferase